MTARYSQRAKARLAHKFRQHPSAGPLEERVFGNYHGLYGHCQHQPPRYVYIRYSEQKLRQHHQSLLAQLQEGVNADYTVWVAEFYQQQHDTLMAQFA